MVPNFAHFMVTLKLGRKEKLQGQTRAQRQGDFMDSANVFQQPVVNNSTSRFQVCQEDETTTQTYKVM
jgi:hypothetical protein